MGGGLLSHNLIIDRQIETSSLSLSSFMGSVFLVRISLIIYNISAICSLKILSRHENEDTRCGTLSLTHCLGASLLSCDRWRHRYQVVEFRPPTKKDTAGICSRGTKPREKRRRYSHY